MMKFAMICDVGTTGKCNNSDDFTHIPAASPSKSDPLSSIIKKEKPTIATQVNCLHCGHTYTTKDSLWEHMKAAKQRLIIESDLEKRCEWLDVLTGLLENEYTGPNSLLVTLESEVDEVVKKRRVESSQGCEEDLEEYRQFARVPEDPLAPLDELETELRVEDWYLIPEKRPPRRRDRKISRRSILQKSSLKVIN